MGFKWGTLEQRFWSKVTKGDGCWIWTASRSSDGYGSLYEGRGSQRNLPAHRVAYELLVGPIPDGLEIDHLCRNRACVNPAHLEPVSKLENLRRGNGAPAVNARKTHCKYGHSLEDCYFYPERRQRVCRTCTKIRHQREAAS